ncbi:MAG: hypothetical protein CMJ35_03585 [Phycisphaerae bacterium]|nr:hypothetical protein [Phycisphaerae bacterium]MBM90681.1 hypothetical protein [Phycisphaerae bacterium]
MNLSQFFEHWSIVENPFRDEEARHDAIFARMGISPIPRAESGAEAAPGALPLAMPRMQSMHPDFEKILGDVGQPSTSIVFGEKGSGKTAIRLQLAAKIERHNAASPDRKVFLIPYDDLNAALDHYNSSVSSKKDANPFTEMRLVDHIDAILSNGVSRVLGTLLPGGNDAPTADLGEHPTKAARKLPQSVRKDMLLLQAVYDSADTSGQRTAQLRHMLKLPAGGINPLIAILLWIGWVPSIALFLWARMFAEFEGMWVMGTDIVSGLLFLAWAGIMIKAFLLDRLVVNRVAGKLSKQLRMVNRPTNGYLGSLRRMPRSVLGSGELPLDDSDEQRYAMLGRLRRFIEHFGYTGILVVIDRVDEPTLINGDPDRMRSVIWPLLNNKFLQLEHVGIKMLLPIELRHALFKESSAFFQEARLDKQNMIERLSWTGAMLYDLCNARLGVCRPANAEPISLIDIFDEDVTRNDLVEALNNMQQPRDAFKFMYRVLSEHCASVTAEDGRWRVARHTLDRVRRDEAERVMQLQRGIRPA